MDLRYSLLQLFGLLLSCLLLAHWGACGYRFVVFYEDIDIADRFLWINEMNDWMNDWMDEWMDEWMDGWLR